MEDLSRRTFKNLHIHTILSYRWGTVEEAAVNIPILQVKLLRLREMSKWLKVTKLVKFDVRAQTVCWGVSLAPESHKAGTQSPSDLAQFKPQTASRDPLPSCI